MEVPVGYDAAYAGGYPQVPTGRAALEPSPGVDDARLPVPVPSSTVMVGSRRIYVGGFESRTGRTTVAAGLGMAMAANRHDRVVAIDACPDRAHALHTRAGLSARGVGVRDMVYAGRTLTSLADVRRYLASSGPAGLEVLPGVRDAESPGPTAEELWYALAILEYWFPVVIVDAPVDWGEPPSATLLTRTDTLVVVLGAGVGEPAAADTALDTLASLGRGDLVESCVVAVVEVDPPRFALWRRRPRPGRFARDAHAVVRVPYDPALAGGGPFTWQRLRRRTRAAFEELAAAVESAPC